MKLSYAQFRKFTEGKDLRVELGNEAYKMTDEQAGAMRAMTAYIRE